MGYTVKEDGTRAWSTTELNCPQTEAGECVCQDNGTAGEQTLFDKADEYAEAIAKVDESGDNASLLDLARTMPSMAMALLPLEPVADNPDEIFTDKSYCYGIHFQNLQPGDIIRLFMPFENIKGLDYRLFKYIKRLIVCSETSSLFLESSLDLHSLEMGKRAFMVSEDVYGAIRLHGKYLNEQIPEYCMGRSLSRKEDYGAYALTGSFMGNYHYESFVGEVPYSFLKYAYISDGGIYFEFKINSNKLDNTINTFHTAVNIYIHLPKNEIIKAIEQEMMGK